MNKQIKKIILLTVLAFYVAVAGIFATQNQEIDFFNGDAPSEVEFYVEVANDNTGQLVEITMEVFDADFEDEGELIINDKGSFKLFAHSAKKQRDGQWATIVYRTPAEWWLEQGNKITVKHTQTQGFKIRNFHARYIKGANDEYWLCVLANYFTGSWIDTCNNDLTSGRTPTPIFKTAVSFKANNPTELTSQLDKCQGDNTCYITLARGNYGHFTYTKGMNNIYIKSEERHKAVFESIYFTDMQNSVIDEIRTVGSLEIRGAFDNSIVNNRITQGPLLINGNCDSSKGCNNIMQSGQNYIAYNYVNPERSAKSNGIDIFMANNNIIERNEVEGTQYVGILVNTASAKNIIRHNNVHDVVQDGIQVKGFGDQTQDKYSNEPDWFKDKTRLNLVYRNKITNAGLGILVNHKSQSALIIANDVKKTGYIESYTDGNCYKFSEQAYNVIVASNTAQNCKRNAYGFGGSNSPSTGLAIGNNPKNGYSTPAGSDVKNFDTRDGTKDLPRVFKVGDPKYFDNTYTLTYQGNSTTVTATQGEWTFYNRVLGKAPRDAPRYSVFRKSDGAFCLYDFEGDGKWMNLGKKGNCDS